MNARIKVTMTIEVSEADAVDVDTMLCEEFDALEIRIGNRPWVVNPPRRNVEVESIEERFPVTFTLEEGWVPDA